MMFGSFLFVFLSALFLGGTLGMEESMDLERLAIEESWALTDQIYPSAMSIFFSLKGSAEDIATNEVDKTARNTANDLLMKVCAAAEKITANITNTEDTAENLAKKAAATEVVKGMYQCAGILSNFIASSMMESDTKGPTEGAEEIIKGLYQGAAKLVACVNGAKTAGQVVMDTAM